MHFLLSTLPEPTRRNYLEKLSVSIRFWREKGGCLSEETIARLQKAGIRIEVGDKSAYRTDKRPVRMEYLHSETRPRLQIHGFFAQQERNAAPQENHGKI